VAGRDAPLDRTGGAGTPEVRDWVVGIGSFVAVGVLVVEQFHSDRLPVGDWVPLAAFVVIGLIAGLGVRGARLKLGVAGLGAIVWPLVAGAAGDPGDGPLASLALILVAGLGLAVGSVGRRILERGTGRRRVPGAVVGVAFVVGLAPYPVAVIERDRTVRVAHPAGRVIDERAGTFRGVGLGDPAARVSLGLGRPGTLGGAAQTEEFGPLVGSEAFDGPSSMDVGSSPEDVFMRYPHVAFQIRAGRVRSVQVDDRSAATAAGVGPGDSISLVRRAYPRATCGEDAIHEEPDDLPYPVCELRLAANRWLTFFGTYGRPGEPVVAVWLSVDDLESGG